MTARRAYVLKPDPHSSHSVILGWLGEGGGRRLLDVGAADGLLSRPLTERGWRVTAIEADPAAARKGATACDRMIVADLNRDAPQLEGTFDAILYADILEHLIDPAAVLEMFNRHLAPGGLVVVSVPNVAHVWIRLGLLAGRFEYGDRGILDRTHLRFFTKRSLRTLLGKSGLNVARFTSTPVPLYQVLPPRWHTGWLAAVHAASAWTARRLPRLLGYQFLVLARRGR
ncbi:MAG: class I SAM-dependent methyltransferase [Candidatus Rokuibacteriota bacterium]